LKAFGPLHPSNLPVVVGGNKHQGVRDRARLAHSDRCRSPLRTARVRLRVRAIARSPPATKPDSRLHFRTMSAIRTSSRARESTCEHVVYAHLCELGNAKRDERTRCPMTSNDHRDRAQPEAKSLRDRTPSATLRSQKAKCRSNVRRLFL
jgi:hypothetical protein